jgi:hypothetical protein
LDKKCECGWEGSDPIVLETSLKCPECKETLDRLDTKDYETAFALNTLHDLSHPVNFHTVSRLRKLLGEFLSNNIGDIVDDYADTSEIVREYGEAYMEGRMEAYD